MGCELGAGGLVDVGALCADFCEPGDLVYVDSDLGDLWVVVYVLVVFFL